MAIMLRLSNEVARLLQYTKLISASVYPASRFRDRTEREHSHYRDRVRDLFVVQLAIETECLSLRYYLSLGYYPMVQANNPVVTLP